MCRALSTSLVLLLAILLGCGSSPVPSSNGPPAPPNNENPGNSEHAISASLFSMTVHGRIHWPTVPIAGVRLWGTGTEWYVLNPSPGVHDFSSIDNWIATAQAQHVDLIYTFGEIPAWASSNPTAICATGTPAGSCVAPGDLNFDGSGSNQWWKDFVAAVVTHAAGQIKYWEIWNEPTVPGYWQGNNQQMLRMAQDAYAIIKSIDPTAMVITPTPSTGINGVANWMGPYLALGGGQYADIISFHSYSWKTTPGVWPMPEDVVPLMANLKAVLGANGQDTKPLWCTEGSWGDTSGNGFVDQDLHAAFLARHYLLQASAGVQRYYWFAWDNGVNSVGSPDGLWTDIGGVNQTGIAYQEVENWLVDAVPGGACSSAGTTWSCDYTRSGGYQARAIWDSSQSCSAGICSTRDQSVDSVFTHYRDIAGNSVTISNRTVPIGAKPILLENR
jgi:hypothetical protein